MFALALSVLLAGLPDLDRGRAVLHETHNVFVGVVMPGDEYPVPMGLGVVEVVTRWDYTRYWRAAAKR